MLSKRDNPAPLFKRVQHINGEPGAPDISPGVFSSFTEAAISFRMCFGVGVHPVRHEEGDRDAPLGG